MQKSLKTTKMLWKRESKRSDALYVDICEDSGYSFNSDLSSMLDESKVMADKSNELSSHYRKKGDEQYEAKAWFDAIELFNQALCFAESGSEELAHIYADRSLCFFSLKMYDECLKDVKLAKANNCPRAILPVLNKMIGMCGQRKPQVRKDEQNAHQFMPTLSFKANKQHPIAADAIRFGTKADSDRFVEATREIPVGQTILIEDGFVSSTIERYKRCCICLKTTTNLVPCKDCTGSLFCHGSCEKSHLHSVECNTIFPHDDEVGDRVDFGLVIRSILKAFQIIPNVNGLIRFVERVLFDKEYAVGDSILTPQAKYAIFLKNGQKMMKLADKEGEY